MDAPTTASAGNGTSGGSDGGGWFTPRTSPPSPGEDQEPEGYRLAGLRPVGRSLEPPSGAGQDRAGAVRERIQSSADLPPVVPPDFP
ncbi:flavohemoprotein, partial [Streptomyces scabiei]|nr:flavohemoprotein [Streptomyces scabiei]